jgi:hypothetical protein
MKPRNPLRVWRWGLQNAIVRIAMVYAFQRDRFTRLDITQLDQEGLDGILGEMR